MFERDVVSEIEESGITETKINHPRGKRVVKSIKLSEDDKDHRSVKTIELMRDNEYSGRRECSDGHLRNRRNNQYGRKKYNLSSRGHMNHDEELKAVNAVEA